MICTTTILFLLESVEELITLLVYFSKTFTPLNYTFNTISFNLLLKVITNQLWSCQHSYKMSATKLKLTTSLRESYSKTFFGIELFIVVLFYSKLKI